YTARGGALDWIPAWAGGHKDIIVFTLCSLIMAVFAVGSAKMKQAPGRLWAVGIALLGIAFVLYASPWNRFGVGYLTMSLALVAPMYKDKIIPLIVIIPLSIDADMHGRKVRFAILLVSIAIYLSILLIRRSNLSRMAVAFFLSLALILPLKTL